MPGKLLARLSVNSGVFVPTAEQSMLGVHRDQRISPNRLQLPSPGRKPSGAFMTNVQAGLHSASFSTKPLLQPRASKRKWGTWSDFAKQARKGLPTSRTLLLRVRVSGFVGSLQSPRCILLDIELESLSFERRELRSQGAPLNITGSMRPT